MSKTSEESAETASVIDCNRAEANMHDSEARHNLLLCELRKHELREAESKSSFDNSQDYRHGYINFQAPIDENSAPQFTSLVRRIARMRPGMPIVVEINSGGGAIGEGFGMMDTVEEVKNQGIQVTIKVRGSALSMAAVLLQSATHRVIGPNSHIMLHRASFGIKGSADEVKDELETVERLEQHIYSVLAKRTGKTAAWWKKKLGAKKDVWFDAEEALEAGLVDAIG